jgi:hypothetical protein
MKNIRVSFAPRVHVDHTTRRVSFGVVLTGLPFIDPVVNLTASSEQAYRFSTELLNALARLERPEPIPPKVRK